MTTDETKTNIVAALDRWIRQRPGLEFGNYGDVRSYRSELRSITKDGQQARTLLRYVEMSRITGDQLAAAFRGAFSGRLLCERLFHSVKYEKELVIADRLR